MYSLQSRWKIINNELVYFGLRNKENMFNNKIRLTKEELTVLSMLPNELDEENLAKVKRLINKQIVKEEDLVCIPKTLNEARFCKSCVANDYMIPGI